MSDLPPLNDADRQSAMRFVDDEMSSDECQKFEARLAKEPALAAVVDDYRGLQSAFVAEPAPQPSAGFFERVQREVAAGGPRDGDLMTEGDAVPASLHDFEALCRRLIVAAALLIGLGLLVWGGLIRSADSGKLEASPAEMRQEMERLDALLLRDGR